jgi:gliding motility-associated-like protein
MKQFLQIGIFIIIGCNTINAQNQLPEWAGTAHVQNWLSQQDPTFAYELNRYIESIPSLSQGEQPLSESGASLLPPPILNIPVVVHIIHDPNDPINTATNLSIAQIESQITKLNQAFRQTNSNFTNTPAIFQTVAGDAEIEFCLAKTDPNGNSTTGIERHAYSTSNITNTTYIETIIKPATQWNPANYLNIWVVAIPNTNIFGGIQSYSYLPVLGFAGVSNLDGVVVDYRFFGVGHQAIGDGVATIRAVGTYLGLMNIWGSTNPNGTPVGCTSDDGLADTPDQAAPTGMTERSCPTSIPMSCATNDMYSNYMDYMKEQTCQSMFTNDQVNVMRAVLNGLAGAQGFGDRSSLTNSMACNTTCSISLTTSTTNHNCAAIGNGTATVTPSGGTAPYIYTWNTSPIQNTATATGLLHGWYEVTVADALGCQAMVNIEVNEVSTFTGTVTVTDETCNLNDATATIALTGGTAPYTTSWIFPPSGIQTGTTASGLSAGAAVAVATDALGCTFSDTISIDLDCINACDTFVPDLSGVNPSYYINPYTGGFVAGTSGFNDAAKADYFSYSGVNTHLIGGIFAFFYASGSGDLEITVWEGQGGTPGVELASTTVSLSAISNNLLQPFYVEFPSPIPVTSNEFFFGFKIPNATAGDSIGIVTTTIGDLPYGFGRAWEQWSNGTWHPYTSSWNVEIAHAIVPIIASPPIAEFNPTQVVACDEAADVVFNNTSVNSGDFTWTLQGADTVSPVANSPTVNYLNTGTFDAQLIASNGCMADTMFVPNAVTVNDCPTGCDLWATITSSDSVSCYQGNDGTATVTPMDGVAPYTILWSNNATTQTVNNLTAGIHTVTITDANNCSLVGTITIEAPPAWQISVTSTDESCALNDGTANVSASNGLSPYTYAWNTSPVHTTNSLTNLSGGIYIVTVTDSVGCTLSDTAVVDTAPTITITQQSLTNVDCFGAMNGSATISATGGTMPYTYQWSNMNNTPTISNVSGGTYFVTVTDINNCFAVDTIIITEPANPLATSFSNINNVDCNGNMNGSVTVNVTGGTIPYTYNWSNNTNSNTISNLNGGIYFVTVTDNNNCSIIDSVVINEPSVLSVIPTSNDISCNGANDGAASVAVSGGVMPYTYLWSNNNNTNAISNLGSGTYTVTITDANSCTEIDTFNINEPTPIVVSLQSQMNVSCTGGNDGAARISVTGGTIPYSYNWSNNTNLDSISNVTAGIYSVTITDANNCTQVFSLTITQPALPLSTSNIDTTDVLCAGDMNGGFIITSSGGTTPYSYNWNVPNSNSNTISNIGAGNYSVTITDANGCTVVQNLTLTAPNAMTATTAGSNLFCADDQNGTVNITVSGGITPYNYAWNNSPLNTNSLTNLGVGTYIVTVTDGNGCTYIDSAFVTAPPPILVTVTSTPVSCAGGFNGTAAATVTGGVGPYFYLWNNTQTTPAATLLSAGTNTLIVTDQNGCHVTDTFTVGQVPPLTVVNIGSQSTSCNGSSDGTAFIQVSGGTAPISYQWNTNPPQNTNVAIGLAAGTYTVTVTDDNNCTLPPFSITVTEPPVLVIDSIVGIAPLCGLDNDGEITVYASGGTPNYFYQWSGNISTTNVASNLFGGSYFVTVTDANGCNTTGNSTIVAPPNFTGGDVIYSPVTSCQGGNDGFIRVENIQGGVPPYLFSIDGGISYVPDIATYTGLAPGTYTVVFQDDNGCTASEDITIQAPVDLSVDLGGEIEILMGESAQLMATVTPSSAIVSYSWSSVDTTMSCYNCSDPTIMPFTKTWYILTITDANGCTATDSIEVKVRKERRVFIPSAFTPNNDGNNDLFIVYGGTGVTEILSFRVFDRWGEVVHAVENFPPNSEEHGWDGRYRGFEMRDDVYVYLIEVQFLDGGVLEYSGDVTLVR